LAGERRIGPSMSESKNSLTGKGGRKNGNGNGRTGPSVSSVGRGSANRRTKLEDKKECKYADNKPIRAINR